MISTKRMGAYSPCGTDPLEQIHQYILEHYAEDLSLDLSWVEHFGLSLSYLSRSFNETLSQRINQFSHGNPY